MASIQQQKMCGSCQDQPEKIQALKNARMFKAVRDRHLNCLRAAIEAGAKVNEYDEPTGARKVILDGYQLDSYGIEFCKILKCVDDHGSDPQRTALIYAVEDRWLEGVELLIESGADVNICDTNHQSPLRIAREFNYEELEQMLKVAGADMDLEREIENIY